MPNKNVRGRAAWALEAIGDARAVEPLIEALKDESDEKDESEAVCRGAADALGKIRSKQN